MPYKNSPHHPPQGIFATAYSLARADWILSYTPIDFTLDNDQDDHLLEVRESGGGRSMGKHASYMHRVYQTDTNWVSGNPQ